ncbi:NAD(P)-dependent oxidoreductase [Pseudonocardia xishanensis]|uniref:SDR family oxidoreductase n=1 Tax=Pseudonocardia xishanensis TaxID=630995 RepID=A0ABP8RYE1_9PSEU
MARVLITGGSGLIGWRAVEQFVETGHEVVVYDLRPNYENLAGVRDEVEVVTGDVTDLPRLLSVMKKHRIDRVLHLAAFIAHESHSSPVASFTVNIMGSANVFDAALALDVERVCWASTVNAVGIMPDYDGTPVDEDYRCSPVSPYGAAKYGCEVMAGVYRAERGLDVIGIRPSLAYGLGRLTGGTGLFNDAVRRVAVGEPAVVNDFGRVPHSPIYNRDMAAMFVAGTLAPRTEHHLFNTPVEATYTGEEIAALLRKIRSDADVRVEPFPDYATPAPVMDGSRARAELGFTPRYTLEEGLREMLDFYTSAPTSEAQS